MIIWILFSSLILLGLISWLATRFNWFHSGEENKEPIETEVCCGAHEVCEIDSLQIVDIKPIYYDDEELDAFIDKEAISYTDAEIEQFEYIFETLASEEMAGWLKSLQLRNIHLPTFLYEQALLIVAERRASAQ